MEKEDIIKEVIKIIRQFLSEDYKVFLFGSWAKGTAVNESDLDIAILGPQAVEQEIMIRVKSGISGIPTLRTIDIVDLNSVGEEFKNKVLEHAQAIN